jgi:hypothetical protein
MEVLPEYACFVLAAHHTKLAIAGHPSSSICQIVHGLRRDAAYRAASVEAPGINLRGVFSELEITQTGVWIGGCSGTGMAMGKPLGDEILSLWPLPS